MANMSYCRMENTYRDLMDCIEALEEKNSLSKTEKRYAKHIVKAMVEFLDGEDLIDVPEDFVERLEDFMDGIDED